MVVFLTSASKFNNEPNGVICDVNANNDRASPSMKTLQADALTFLWKLRRVVPPDEARRVVPPDEARRVVPPDDARRVVPPDEARRVVPPDDARRVVPPDDARRVASRPGPRVTAGDNAKRET